MAFPPVFGVQFDQARARRQWGMLAEEMYPFLAEIAAKAARRNQQRRPPGRRGLTSRTYRITVLQVVVLGKTSMPRLGL
jgi:hypothetical protein